LSRKKYSTRLICFGIDTLPNRRQNLIMGQAVRPKCPHCWAYLTLVLPPGGEGKRTFQCFDCDRPDPMTTEKAIGWLKGELQPPKREKPAMTPDERLKLQKELIAARDR